jgi:hypothetical protein
MRQFRNTGYFVLKDGSIIGKKKALKQTLTPDGYLSVCLYYQGKGKTFLSHRMVAECFIPAVENKPDINHKNGVKTDNHISNLEWVTKKENVSHFLKELSTRKIGEFPNSKLSHQDMVDIYECFTTQCIYQKEIAKRYRVHRTTIQFAIKTIRQQI